MKLTRLLSLFALMLLFIRCGDPDVDITTAKYEPKISVEAYLFCGETVKNIRLTRNFELGKQIDVNKLYLTPISNDVTVTLNGVPLLFNDNNKTYYNDQITVEYGKSYEIDISATIDGKQLYTTSKTTTPQKGFSILQHDLGTAEFKNQSLKIDFKTSPGTDLYIFSFIADTATLGNFIYENPLFPNIDSSEVADNFNTYRYQYSMITDIDSYSGQNYSYKLQSFDFWFYSTYKVTAYAGDRNFRYYLLTAPDVKEFDGNFHEPIQIFDGDGIGVFASAIRETITFRIVK